MKARQPRGCAHGPPNGALHYHALHLTFVNFTSSPAPCNCTDIGNGYIVALKRHDIFEMGDCDFVRHGSRSRVSCTVSPRIRPLSLSGIESSDTQRRPGSTTTSDQESPLRQTRWPSECELHTLPLLGLVSSG